MAASADNAALARLFYTASRILELKGENPFKAIAFQKVADVLENLSDDLRGIYNAGGKKAVEEIKGIGGSSARIITDWLSTGRSPDYESLALSVPEGLVPMLRIPGLGPKTIRLFWQERGITSIDELSKALADGSLEGLRGIGKKKLDQIRQGIEDQAVASRRPSLGRAIRIAEGILEQLRALPGVKQAEAAGSLRRGRDTVGDIDLLVAVGPKTDGGAILEAFSRFGQFARVLGQGESKCSVVTHEGLQVDCRLVPATSWGAALMYFTGSKQHNVHLRSIAQSRKHTLNEWGIYEQKAWEAHKRKPGQFPAIPPIAGKTEEEVYGWFGMDFIPPELREDTGEIELAAKHELPKLITRTDYRGDLHTHTEASDGMCSIEQLTEAAIGLGYKYLAITDHSKAQVQANGLEPKRLMKHVEAIRRANERYSEIELFAGSEVDILVDGQLDYEDAILAELDWVIASPHISLRQDGPTATSRLLRAIENRYVHVIGHPTGRIVNGRPGLPLDMGAVIKAAAEAGVALEINANYARLDLSDAHARAAIDAGCMISINSDAHSIAELRDQLAGGITTARRAWARKQDVVNCLTVPQLRKFMASRR